jgi:hypothetical protein
VNQGSGNGNSIDSQNMVVLYGMAPSETSPRVPDIVVPFVIPADLGGPIPDAGALSPCAKCRRHIRYGTECPFCFAQAAVDAAKSPGRATVDAAIAECREAFARMGVAGEKATEAYTHTRADAPKLQEALSAALTELASARIRLACAIAKLEGKVDP